MLDRKIEDLHNSTKNYCVETNIIFNKANCKKNDCDE